MKDQKGSLIKFIQLGFLSFFGSGYLPKMPGTYGSLATIPLIYLFSYLGLSLFQLITFTFIVFVIACWVADIVQRREQVQDPGWIVIDEVIGMLITWMFVFPKVDLVNIFLVFAVFRFFDIIKIFPANWCDKKIKNGAGTIIDDVVSGLYAGIVVWLVNYFQLIP